MLPLILMLMICSSNRIWATSIAGYSFRALVNKSEVIVEGVVKTQKALDRPIVRDHYLGTATFLIKKVYKGKVNKGETVTVLNAPLQKGSRYLLMLTRKDSAYVDTNYGQGTWKLFTKGNVTKVNVDGHSTGSRLVQNHNLLLSPNAMSFEEFIKILQWAFGTPDPDAEVIVNTAGQAEGIARRVVEEAGFDLSQYQLTKVKHLKIASDLIGVTYEGDPMWLVRWERPDAKGKNPRPPGSFVYCYVHAQTGKTIYGPRVEPEK